MDDRVHTFPSRVYVRQTTDDLPVLCQIYTHVSCLHVGLGRGWRHDIDYT